MVAEAPPPCAADFAFFYGSSEHGCAGDWGGRDLGPPSPEDKLWTTMALLEFHRLNRLAGSGPERKQAHNNKSTYDSRDSPRSPSIGLKADLSPPSYSSVSRMPNLRCR